MGEPNRGYVLAVGLAVLGALAMGQGMRGDDEPRRYRDLGGPRALWSIPDGEALPFSPPARVTIPGIEVDAPTMRLGQRDDGTVDVPPFGRAEQAGWYEHGPAPGARGSAVVLGHYDDTGGPAVFYRLRELKPGARVKITRKDRRVAVFTVDAVERVPKFEFPRTRVYGDVRYAGLRLVTCGGPYDRADRSYRDNVIVYAHLTGEEGRPAQARP
ncbi:class F sortase [Actinomadura flavalba]|uniref:class F sortase n=1 Tax=Actinomadura flavalba TaxID=1120938 RepID=UPI0003698A42|nr:class F sortase [Actinomadura flavalba]